MIEYKLKHRDDSYVTLDELKEFNTTITSLFPEVEREKVGDKIRVSYGTNGHAFHIYFGEKASRIGLPVKYHKEIKKVLKNIEGVKLEGARRCR